ncbi:PREDICTED: uncharacterized protein LOC105365895 isoform X2 [Ceratosolen solmsi marchali]|uniref:Uncharacterized protein LOC105365895 isoform X2 n=1 Tax=Ceratosolen solmsi marchali TaxID=326594 RepID=A0AAJ7DZU5_9HYME|nr:PREDICTED: uncharacterized protein LOC105365895 isoform X2 [Ceratosolen solmsi marchali]
MAREESRSKKPFKIWDSWRNIRKGLVVSNLEELVHRGKEKLGIPINENVVLVLESDGTQIDDGEYFKTLSNNTILILLRNGESWCPTGVDIIRAAISAIPKIVCETIHALELHDETPTWEIMDNKGRVTVALHWDHRSSSTNQVQQTKIFDSAQNTKYSSLKKSKLYSSQKPSLVIQTSLDKLNYGTKLSTCSELITPVSHYNSPQITVINHDDIIQRKYSSPNNSSYGPISQHGHLLKKSTSSFDSTITHIHTSECLNHINEPIISNGSPVNITDNTSGQECDFHCYALHEEGRRIAVHKSVATSPIQDTYGVQQQLQILSSQPVSSLSDNTRRQSIVKGHVRFCDTTEEEEQRGIYPFDQIHQYHTEQHESSESETENTIMEDEIVTSEKFLLLIDQLTVEQKNHLSIKDIGIILERLSSKILDVERLDRENESEDCYNWTIKAIIRGDMLRELGVIYNGNYYIISEHPGYKEESEENNEDNEDDEEENRL